MKNSSELKRVGKYRCKDTRDLKEFIKIDSSRKTSRCIVLKVTKYKDRDRILNIVRSRKELYTKESP